MRVGDMLLGEDGRKLSLKIKYEVRRRRNRDMEA